MELTCPKCQGPMRTYERNGVHVDQCADCRGIFLDRGELERLIDAENAWHGDARPSSASSSSMSSSSSSSAGHVAAGSGLGAVVSEVLGQTRGHRSSGRGYRYDDDRYDDDRYDDDRYDGDRYDGDRYDDDRYDDDHDRRYDQHGRSYGHGQPRRKKSFLSELFD